MEKPCAFFLLGRQPHFRKAPPEEGLRGRWKIDYSSAALASAMILAWFALGTSS